MLLRMIHVEDRGEHGRVRLVTIDRPERRNALDHEALAGLQAAIDDAIERVADGHRTRVVVLAGAGGHFCAGADLTGVEDAEFVRTLNRLLMTWRDAPVPTIAAVEGAALGAGTQLAVACDLRCAAPDATFGIPAAKLGLMVDQWTVQRLVNLAGQSVARGMLVGGLTYSGAEAHGVGFSQRQGGVDTALDWADTLAALAPLTIAGHKFGLNEAETIEASSPGYQERFAAAWASADLQEGLAAFRERRPAAFHGD
jgi:enoyl-CoA hydratase